jgi:hypothetical protein
MASRLYFTSNAFAGPVYPPDANWNDVTQCTTQSSDMVNTLSGDAPFSQTAQKNSGANPHSILHIRYRIALPAGILLQGNIRGQHFGQCPGTTGAMRAISVRVFDSGTTLRANLVQHFPAALSSGFTGTLTNRFYPPSVPITTNYTTVAGDVLVVEVGVKWFTASSGGTVTAAIRFGDSGVVDLPVDETTGVAVPEQNSWIEFESVNLFGAHDDWLMTTSGPILSRLPSPSKRGVHHFDTDNLIETIYAGSAVGWKRIAISANGGAPIGTEINFANTEDINVSLVGQNFQWNAQALSPVSNRTKQLTLTDDVTEGCLLTADNTFSANSIAFKAPNATNTLRVGKYGNISMAGTALSDFTLVNLLKIDYNETSTVRSMNFTVANTNVGSGGTIVQGAFGTVQAPCNNAAGTTTNSVIGFAYTLAGGSSGNNNFLGNVIGYRVNTITLAHATIGTTVPLVVGFEYGSAASPLIATRTLITDHMGFRARMGATLFTSAAITTATGFRCEAITQGTNRYGVDIAAFTTGTPAVSYGVQVGTHSVGTIRRALIGGNTVESTANDFLCSTAAKGLITKDAQGTARFWRMYNDVSGATSVGGTVAIDVNGWATFSRGASPAGTIRLQIGDVGTSAPAT